MGEEEFSSKIAIDEEHWKFESYDIIIPPTISKNDQISRSYFLFFLVPDFTAKTLKKMIDHFFELLSFTRQHLSFFDVSSYLEL